MPSEALPGPALPPELLARIEDAGLNASAPPQQRWLDGWLLRLSPGKAKRARCINALADGRRPWRERLAEAQAIYRDAGLPLIFRVTPFTQPAGLDAWLAAQGFRRFDDTRVMVNASLADLPAALPAGQQLVAMPAADFAEQVGAWRGSPPAQREAHAERLALAPVRSHPFALTVQGDPVAAGQFVVEGEVVGLYDIFTPVHMRNRGYAQSLCRALLARAQALGARVAYLQVDSDNTPARAVYGRLGFADAYAYGYRTDDPDAH
jgi:ribosomal protein S18 acetylase RimI-like enzyme